ncbi:MAG: hypothetical protein OER90_03250 [Gemmatimonadota bacterium]|nr:hypothetical protein [Gemmatimonadota bacterium]
MSNPSPFDHRRDPELGQAMRDVLTPPDEARFVARVVAAAESVYGGAVPSPMLNILTAWARPGLVAAMLLIAVAAFSAGLWIGRSGAAVTAASPTIGDPLVDSGQLAVPALMAGQEAPDVDVVLAVAMGR